jgi:hypothetical protein
MKHQFVSKPVYGFARPCRPVYGSAIDAAIAQSARPLGTSPTREALANRSIIDKCKKMPNIGRVLKARALCAIAASIGAAT